LASSMVDRMIAEAKKHTLPDWCPGGTKEAEWSKRKRLWVAEEARDAAAAVQARNQVNARVARAITRPRFHLPQPLFLEDEDEEEDDYYNIDDLGYEDDVVLRSIGRLLSEPTLTITYTMATPADDHSEKVLVYHEWLNVLGPLTTGNVLEYFAACQLFWDPQCNNNILRMQSQHLGTSVNLDELKNMKGIEYAVVHAEPPTLFIIHKRERLSPTETRPIEAYYVYKNTIHKAFDLYSLVSNRLSTAVNCLSDSLSLIRPYKPEFSPRTGYQWWALRHQSYFHLAFTILRNIIDDSVEEGDDSNTNQLRNQPKRQVATIPGMMAALQTTRSHMEQQYQEKQKRAEQEAAANAVASSGTAPGTRPASVAPMTPAPDAIPRPPDADASAIASAAKTPAPRGKGRRSRNVSGY
ncbi:MED6Hypothetical protein, partial [Rhizoctonia solani]